MQTGWKDGDETESDGEGSPLTGRQMRTGSLVDPSLRIARRPITPDPFIDDDAAYEYDDQEDHSQRGSDEVNRLKGVFWPGMDIFDSATEEMRRKRNQKKDGSIIKQMEETSESVEPTELVFSPNGTLRKQRVISGMVDDSSPLKGETPIPKKKVTRPRRRPMSQLSGNVQMAQSRYKMRIREQSRAAQLEILSQQALMLGNPGDSMNYPLSDSQRQVLYNTSKYGLENSIYKPYYGPFKPPSTGW